MVTNASTWYVATNGDNTNPGTFESPFLTVSNGIRVAQAGDTVFVGQGTYNEDLVTVRSGSSDSPITLNGQSVATVLAFVLQHQYIYLLNFTISGLTNNFRSLLLMNRGADYCLVSNNIMDLNYTPFVYCMSWTGPSTTPFGDDAANHDLVVNNTFKRGIAVPMVTIYGDFNILRGNRLIDGAVVDWFRLWGRSNSIIANICSNSIFATNEGNHADFIQTFGNGNAGSRWHLIEDNLIMQSEEMQLHMLTADGVSEIRDWTFRNNIYVDMSSAGICCIPGVVFYNNTFVRCDTTNGGHALAFGTAFSGSADSCRVFNNVFLDCGDSRTTVGWYSFTTNLVDVAADYNYVGKNGYQPVDVDPLHRSIGDPGGWDNIGQVWWENHGINGGNPLFLNESTMNYHLLSGSPLIGAATNLNSLFTTDYDGKTRGLIWDIGAFESEKIHMKMLGKSIFKGKATIR